MQQFSFELFLVRHGQSVANTHELVCGQLDSPLTELGLEQANKTADLLNKLVSNSHKVISSPLQRALNTAKVFAAPSKNIEIARDLMEVDCGDVSTLTYYQLFEIEPKFQNFGDSWLIPFPNGESLNDMKVRIDGWINNHLRYNLQGQTIIFSHAYALNCILHRACSISTDTFPKYKLLNGSVTRIRFNKVEELLDGEVKSLDIFTI